MSEALQTAGLNIDEVSMRRLRLLLEVALDCRDILLRGERPAELVLGTGTKRHIRVGKDEYEVEE